MLAVSSLANKLARSFANIWLVGFHLLVPAFLGQRLGDHSGPLHAPILNASDLLGAPPGGDHSGLPCEDGCGRAPRT